LAVDLELHIVENGSLKSLATVEWKQLVLDAIERGRRRLDFMSDDHHKIRRAAVTELVRTGKPIAPGSFASQFQIPFPRVVEILDELERNLFFLVRNPEGAVSWAFPFTTDQTPHRLTFSTGERLYGA
jgi:hypothetical protein